MSERESWMPSDEEINAACNEDDSPHYQPGEASFVTTAPLVRAFVRTAVERALAEQEARHRREVIEAEISILNRIGCYRMPEHEGCDMALISADEACWRCSTLLFKLTELAALEVKP